MKQRNLRPAVPSPTNWFLRPAVSWWFEFDDHGMNICAEHPTTGEVYEWSGIRRTGVLEPCAPKVE